MLGEVEPAGLALVTPRLQVAARRAGKAKARVAAYAEFDRLRVCVLTLRARRGRGRRLAHARGSDRKVSYGSDTVAPSPTAEMLKVDVAVFAV